MLKTKHALSALGLLVAMTMATDALAQGVFSVSSSIEPRARLNGQTEDAGGITLSLESGGLTDADNETGTVVINYGTTITNRTATGVAIMICGVAGAEGATGNTTIAGSTITLDVNEDQTSTVDDCGDDATINVEGVKLAIAGQGLSSVAANITSSGDVRLGSGANELAVINSVVDELEDGGVSADEVTLIRHTAAPSGDMYFKLLVEENAVDSFDDAALNLEFSGIMDGMSVTIDAWVSTKADVDDLEPTAFVLNGVASPAEDATDDPTTMGIDETVMNVTSNAQLALAGGTDENDVLAQTLTAMDNEAQVLMGLGTAFGARDAQGMIEDDTDTDNVDESTIMGGSLNSNEIDVVVIRGRISVTTRGPGAADLPLGDLDIAATVDVGPTGPAVYGRTHRGATPIPRFASDPTAAVTVIDVESDQTTLSLPYALSNGVFDTGIAVSNMNTDTEQSGTITFQLFQTGEDMVEWTTPDELAAGGTMAILLSEILLGAGVETFQGYMMVVTDFTGADGVAYISDWAAFSATATLDVVEE